MGVDLKTVWEVAQEQLPELKPLLEGYSIEDTNHRHDGGLRIVVLSREDARS